MCSRSSRWSSRSRRSSSSASRSRAASVDPTAPRLQQDYRFVLEIKDLYAKAGDRDILRGISLSVAPGEVHAIMGPNGSGKSTLAQVLAGNPAYEVTGGSATFEGKDLLSLPPEERAQAGVFLAFQYPVEIPGVSNAYFLRASYNEIRKAHNEKKNNPLEFADLM